MVKILRVSVVFAMLGALYFPLHVSADVFRISFFYDQERDFLSFDDRIDSPVQVDTEKSIDITVFENPPKKGSFEYAFFDVTGAGMFSVEFTPAPGYFSVELPYFSIAKTLKVRRLGQQNYFLERDITSLISCNANGVCEFEKKENVDTCMIDCANGHTQYSQQTKTLLDQNGGVVKDPKTGEVLLRDIPVDINVEGSQQPNSQSNVSNSLSTILIVLGVIVAGVFIVLVVLYFRSRY